MQTEPYHIARQRYVTMRWLEFRKTLELGKVPLPSVEYQIDHMRRLAEQYDLTCPEKNYCAPDNNP